LPFEFCLPNTVRAVPGKRGGNPPSYEAIRGSTWVYVEYDSGEKEYHDRTADRDELHNTYLSLPDEQKASLHTCSPGW
jgi:N-acetylglucosamine-6-sulfatase